MMKDILVSRKKECEEIQRCMESNRSEFITINGRRRIGKTYLVDSYFNYKYDFTFVGEHNTPAKIQIQNFMRAIQKFSKSKTSNASNWYEAFNVLEDYLEGLPNDRKKVIFIDEMPWMDTQRSNFVSALENFWNGWANRRKDIVLIATGSATSWMSDKLVRNKGGLHNRITCNLHLAPFTLHEVEEYLQTVNCRWERYQIVQCYMVFGGVPFYLSLLRPKESLAQNIDRLFFSEGAQLREEFDELYNALFNKSDFYISVVKLLASNKEGLTRAEIKERTKIEGSFLSKVLKNLAKCDFITAYSHFGQRKNNAVYRLTDFFTLFYYKFLEDENSKDESWWSRNLNSQSVRVWQGLSFELVCLYHHRQIKSALGISGVGTTVSTWKSNIRRNKRKKDKTSQSEDNSIVAPGYQIDMIIDRADHLTHLCEMKFSNGKYKISIEDEEKLRTRMGLFDEATGRRHSLMNTFVTTYGVVDGKYKSIVDSEVTMDDLFNS